MNIDSTVENTTITNITVPTTGSYFHSYPDKDKSPNSKSIVVRNISFNSDDMFDNGIKYKTSDGKELQLFNRGNGQVVYGLHTFYTSQNGKMVSINPTDIDYKFKSDEFLRGFMIDLDNPVYERDTNNNVKLDSNGNKIPIPNLYWTKPC
mgnify:CR=1 FL=1|tara:strand:+ start:86 stop:535 length:450 start_codon:yes stop_codon:yes gene_type:complete